MLVTPNFPVILAVALIPMIVGAIYYNPKVMGNFWMKASGVTEEKAASGNMILIFGLAYLLSVMLCMMMMSFSIHQFQIQSLFVGSPGMEDTSSDLYKQVSAFISEHKDVHRTFSHGAVHGAFFTFFIFLPIVGIITLFERRGWQYLLSHLGYWLITLVLVCGLLCKYN